MVVDEIFVVLPLAQEFMYVADQTQLFNLLTHDVRKKLLRKYISSTVIERADTHIFAEKSRNVLAQAKQPRPQHYSKWCGASGKQVCVPIHQTTRDEKALLKISMYCGEYTGDLTSLVHICDVEGSVVQGRQPFSLFEETLNILEVYADGTPRPSVEYVTVFIGRKTPLAVEPPARIAVATRNGRTGACFRPETSTRVDTEVIDNGGDDDVVTVVRKVLEVFVRGNRFSDTFYPQSRWRRGHA
jgi:hypothetical protein